ncbi:hypothetical protein AHF37_07954 [Paragonimus kellicotti]|nr:hypothetical protein AHF37_07954 [Paragonimus kellicotti]
MVLVTNEKQNRTAEDLIVEALTLTLGPHIVRGIRLNEITEQKANYAVSAFVYLDSKVFFSQQSGTLQLNSANELLKNMITAPLGGFSEHVSLVGNLNMIGRFVGEQLRTTWSGFIYPATLPERK